VDEHENDEHVDSDEQLQSSVFDPTAIGLKEINNLAHFGVSSHKPGNGVQELLSDDLDKYWQYVPLSFFPCYVSCRSEHVVEWRLPSLKV
jgi:Anaphase-promoting complex, subunit 10 (APC10)